MSLSQTLDDMDSFPVGDDSRGLLVDPNMIPTVATEVVMGDDGIEREFGRDGEEYHEYEYAYDDDDQDDPHHPHHPHHLLHGEEVVVAEEEYPEDWKDKKVNLYDALDGKMYMEEKKSSQQFVYDTGSAPPGGVEWPQEVEEYREYVHYPAPNRPIATGGADRPCPGCGMTLRRSVFYHHARMIREKGACNLFTPQRFPCTQCDSRIGTLEKLCQHMEQIHNAPTQIRNISFTCEADFQAFRIELEGKGGNFRMARGNKKNKKGVVQYFRCNRLQTLARSQTYRPVDNPANGDLPSNRKRGRLHHQQDKRPQSAKQVIRTENSCTAFYNKHLLDNGMIEVRYCDHHLHDDEKLRLPDAVRARVIELAKKNLPHIVILMIIKDERFKFCEKNSANDRRINEMKTQDVRQVLAGNTRAAKTRLARHSKLQEASRNTSYEKTNDESEMQMNTTEMHINTAEIDTNPRAWADRPVSQKVDRDILSHTELRYFDLFESNREEIMARLNEKTRSENEKRLNYDQFIHRLSSSQDIFKTMDAAQLPATEATLHKLKKAFSFLSRIEEKLLHPGRELEEEEEFVSYIRLMEQESQQAVQEMAQEEETAGHVEEEEDVDVDVDVVDVDVVGIDEDFQHHHHLHEVVEEEEVVGYQLDDDDEEYMNVEEGEVEIQMEEVEGEVVGEEEVIGEEEVVGQEEEVLMEQELVQEEQQEGQLAEQQEPDEEDDEEAEPTVTRAGRVVKKKTVFDS